jgi:hypothetical protein
LLQTVEKVVASLIKQLASPFNHFHPCLDSLYGKSKTGSTKPNLYGLVEILTDFSKKLRTSTCIIFDAFDECDIDQQGIMLSDVIVPLCKAGVKIYVTTRPHCLPLFENKVDAAITTNLRIKTDPEDVKDYLSREIERSPKRIGEKLKSEIVDVIGRKSDGMYHRLLLTFLI